MVRIGLAICCYKSDVFEKKVCRKVNVSIFILRLVLLEQVVDSPVCCQYEVTFDVPMRGRLRLE